MESTNIIALQEAWQQAVLEHAAFIRQARTAQLSAGEMHKRTRIHLLRIDTTFSKLKAAEEHSRELR
jgi:hypothetical protein